MAERRWAAIAVLGAVGVGVAVRAIPLAVSPLPATLDAFGYVRGAAAILASGHIGAAGLAADELVFAALLATTSALVGVTPLRLAQPLVTVLGAGAALVGAAIAWRVTSDLGWPATRRWQAVALAGLGLAIEGLFVRRTGVPDEEVVGLLLVPVVALAAHRALASRRTAWGLVAAGLLIVLPPLHNLSTTVAVLVTTGIVAAHVARDPSRRTATLGLGLLTLAWVAFLGYYTAADAVGLALSYEGTIRAHPGLFLAWVIVLAVGVAWLRATTRRASRLVLVGSVGSWFVLVGLNAVRPVFPGTVPTHPLVAGLVVTLLVPLLLAAAAWPDGLGTESGPLVAGLVAGPIALVSFALTAALTPVFFDLAIRAQTFAHVGVLVLAGLGAVGLLAGERRRLGRVAVAILVASLVLTVPLAHVDLDTARYPSTTLESEYAAVGFAGTRLPGGFASDHALSREAGHRFPDTATTVVPIHTWLTGGPPPRCAALARASWSNAGAHFYPAGAETIDAATYAGWVAQNNRVYTANGQDSFDVVVPRVGASGC